MQLAGRVRFLLNDTQIIDQTFLEDLNNILNAGEVPNLFPSDEMDRVINDVRPKAALRCPSITIRNLASPSVLSN
eukprot:3187405-Amphidinium_carterae.1